MVVFITHVPAEAHIIAGRLKHEGIPHHIHSQPGASAIGITIGRMGEIKVLVRPQHYDEAVELLFPEEDPALPDSSDYVQGLDDDE